MVRIRPFHHQSTSVVGPSTSEVIQSVVVLRLLGQRVARFAEKTDLLAMLAPDNLTLHYVKVSAAWRAALDAQCTVGRTHCSESIFGHRKSNTVSK